MSFENYKYNAALLGLLGSKITDFLYSRKDDYCRFDLKATDLLYRKDLAKKERIKLMNHNVSYFINDKFIKKIGFLNITPLLSLNSFLLININFN